MKIKHVKISVIGKVQGVFYRNAVKQLADSLLITGRVRNEKDGSVYIEAIGSNSSLEKLIAWCRKGTIWSQVDNVIVVPLNNNTRFEDFKIII